MMRSDGYWTRLTRHESWYDDASDYQNLTEQWAIGPASNIRQHKRYPTCLRLEETSLYLRMPYQNWWYLRTNRKIGRPKMTRNLAHSPQYRQNGHRKACTVSASTGVWQNLHRKAAHDTQFRDSTNDWLLFLEGCSTLSELGSVKVFHGDPVLRRKEKIDCSLQKVVPASLCAE